MSVIYILLPLGILFGAVAVWAFVWATKSGQYDDLDTPRYRMLFDDDRKSE